MRQDSLRFLFEEIMSCFRKLHRSSLWKTALPFIKKVCCETPVPISPEEMPGMVTKLIKAGFDFDQRFVSGMGRPQRNFFDKPLNRDTILPGIIREQIPLSRSLRHCGASHGHRNRRTRECVGTSHGQRAKNRDSADGNSQRNSSGSKRGSIHHHESAKSIRQTTSRSHADAASPVVTHQGDLFQIPFLNESTEIGDVLVNRVSVILGLLGQPHSQMVHRQTPVFRRQGTNQMSPGKAPGRIPVDEKNDRSGSLVDIRITMAIE